MSLVQRWLLAHMNAFKKLYLLQEIKRPTFIPVKDLFISPETVAGLLKSSSLSLVLSLLIKKRDRNVNT